MMTMNDNENYDQDYEVETILAHRKYNRVTKFKVKWVDYPIEQCTWEPIENLQNAKEILHRYCVEHELLESITFQMPLTQKAPVAKEQEKGKQNADEQDIAIVANYDARVTKKPTKTPSGDCDIVGRKHRCGRIVCHQMGQTGEVQIVGICSKPGCQKQAIFSENSVDEEELTAYYVWRCLQTHDRTGISIWRF